MKKFKEYINEEITPQALTDKNFVGVENSSVRDNINSLLSGVTTKSVVTPYVSLERVRKALAYYHIFLPAHQFMEGNSGNVIFNISQFGEKYGQTNTGEFVSKSDSPYFLYFEYQMNDVGLFDVFAEVVDDDELEELLGDYESEMDDSEEEEDDEDEDDTVVSADQQNNYLLNKDEHEGNLKEERLNELKMDKKTYVSVMKRTTGYDSDYSGEGGRVDTDKLIARAKKYKGEKFGGELAGADQMTSRPHRSEVPGQWGSDQLAWRKLTRKTKDGKANKTDLKSLKGSLTKGDYRKPKFKRRDLPESEQLNELKKVAKRAEDKAAKNYYDAYDVETDARKKAIKTKTPEAKKEAEDAKARRLKAAKLVIKFQKYNDKKK
jgi:hypothetical protein